MSDQDAERLRVLEILNAFMQRHGGGRPLDHESLVALERHLAILRMGHRTESRAFLKAFDELTSELRRKLGSEQAGQIKETR